MKRIRRAIAAKLRKPVRRWLTTRVRSAATDYARATISAHVNELLLAAIPGGLAVPGTGAPVPVDPESEDHDRRDDMRTVLIAGVVAALLAGSAIAIAAFVRSRRRARAHEPAEATISPVAIRVDVISTDPDDAGRADPGGEPEPPNGAVVAVADPIPQRP